MKDKKTLETGNLTFVVEIEDSVPDVDYKTLDFSYFVDLPHEYSDKEVRVLILLNFARSIEYWQGEGVNLNASLLLKSFYQALKNAECNDFMNTVGELSADLNSYIASNKEKFLKEGVATVYYDSKSGEFCSGNKKQKKEANKGEIFSEGNIGSSKEVVNEEKQKQVENDVHNVEQNQVVINEINNNLQENKLENLK